MPEAPLDASPSLPASDELDPLVPVSPAVVDASVPVSLAAGVVVPEVVVAPDAGVVVLPEVVGAPEDGVVVPVVDVGALVTAGAFARITSTVSSLPLP